MSTPDTLGGGTLNSWYKADSITGVSDGGSISTWADSSSLAHDLTSLMAVAPVWRATAAPGGNPCVDNIANDGGMCGTSATDFPDGDVTFFAMFKVTSSPSVQWDILGGFTSGNAEFYLQSGNKVGLNRSAQAVVALSTLTFTTGVWTPAILTYVKSTGATTVRLGASQESIAGSANSTFTAATRPQYAAYYSGGTNDFRGQMGEVGCYSSALSSTDADALLAYLNAKYGTPTATGLAPVDVGSSSASSLIATATGLAPVGAATSSAASTVGVPSVTGLAPVNVGSSSAATLVATSTGLSPVGAATSSAPSLVGTLVTTGLAPVSVGSSSAELLGINLVGWSADVSQQSALEITSDEGELDYTPPIVAGTGTWYLPQVGALVLPPTGLTERVITRHSVSVPAMTPDTNHLVHVSDTAMAGYTTVASTVGVPHILIGGQDYTYLRGKPSIIGSYRAEEPFGDVSLVIDLPQITPQDTPGAGDLAALKPDARVELILLNGTTMTRLWSGFMVSDDGGNDEQSSRTAWTAQGTLWQASTFQHRVPTYMPPVDYGTVVARSLNKVIGRVYPVLPIVHTGMPTTERGSSNDTELTYVQTLLAKMWTPSTQWTVAKTAGTSRTYTLRGKDLVTVNQTVTTGAIGVDLNLSRDMTSTANCLLGSGVTVDGYAWAGWCWPNLRPDAAPAYPYSSGSTVMTIGSTDAGTLTGHGVSDWQRRICDLNLSHDVLITGTFNTNDAAATGEIQLAMGLTVDDIVGPQTWDAGQGVGSMSGDLYGAYRRPLAIDPATEAYLYSASGAVTGYNPAYTGAIRRERDTAYNCTKAEAITSAKLELARDKAPGLTGIITLKTDPREGSRFLILPGQNIKVLGYHGADVLLHIASVTVDLVNEAVTLTVDEHSRDAGTLAQIRARNRAAMLDPARRPGHTNRRSQQVNDQIVTFDGESSAGIIPRHAIYGGLWTVIRLPLSQLGDYSKIAVRTESPAAKFSLWLFAGPVTPADLVRLVGDPLSGTNPTARTEAKGNALDDLGLIEAFGGPGSAAGYGYGTEGTDPLTGWLKDNGGGHYNSVAGGWIWLAEWSPVSTFIEGRIFPAPIQ